MPDSYPILQSKSRSKKLIGGWISGFDTVNALLVFILMIAFALRFVGINQVGYNSDEAVYSGQAAAIAQDKTLSEFFPVFRAHPLLFQFLLSVLYRVHVSDFLGRSFSALFGIATVYLVYLLGKDLYNPKTGLLASLLLAIMPYHIVITRQVILDGSMTFFATLTLYLLVRYVQTNQAAWLYASGAGLALTALTKETGIIFLVAIYAFFAFSPSIRIRFRDLMTSMGIMIFLLLPYPLTIALAGGGGVETSRQYLIWQIFRPPNHEWWFYPASVFPAIGLPILICVYGLWVYRKENSWKEVVLLLWITVPLVFFQSWPVKGFHYLCGIAPTIAVLAGRTAGNWKLVEIREVQRTWKSWLNSGVLLVLILSLLIPAWQRIQPQESGRILAGSGGVPGGKEAGLWLRENSPLGSTLMTIGPSMANILQFYGHRRAFGLSVSPNPLHRNPSYLPVRNPDFDIRTGEFQFLVWDSYSASRSEFFSEKLLDYATRYNGRVVHTETVPAMTQDGKLTEKPVIVIYEVRP